MVSGKLHFFNVFLPILVYDFEKRTFIFVHFRLAVPNMSKKNANNAISHAPQPCICCYIIRNVTAMYGSFAISSFTSFRRRDVAATCLLSRNHPNALFLMCGTQRKQPVSGSRNGDVVEEDCFLKKEILKALFTRSPIITIADAFMPTMTYFQHHPLIGFAI